MAVRAFVAVELPDRLRGAVEGVVRGLGHAVPARTVKWVDPDNLHLTLKFLGNVEEDALPAVQSAIASALAPVPNMRLDLQGVGFPNLRRPSVVWLGVDGPGVVSLADAAARIESALEPLGFPWEARPFAAHLTVGRVARFARAGDVRALSEALERAGVGNLGPWPVREVALMRSDLTPSGPVYSRLAVFALA